MVPDLNIDLGREPGERWQDVARYRDGARALVASYLRDLEGTGAREAVALAREAAVPPEYLAEMRGIAKALDLDELDLLVANLYYDALKPVLGWGCTAFAVDTDDGPLHARNLDWWSEDGLLRRESIVIQLDGGPAGRYQMVGWPGFVGCFSGVAERRFAVTLNAVLSDDAPAVAPAIVFVLRRVLEVARGFSEAVDMLTSARVASDSLLLVTGVARGEMVVIERTPTRSALRRPEDGRIVVTNDYRSLATSTTAAPGSLAATSCARFDRTTAMIRERPPDEFACRAVLDDPGVKMAMTAQQMVLSARRGTIDLG